MIAEIGAAYSGLKSAYDIAKGLNSANTQVQVNDIKIALQQHILDAREALDAAKDAETASARRIADLEQEIVRLNDWSSEKQRYKLTDVRHGAMCYTVKPGMEGEDPPHWLCAQCFHQSRKSLLQNKGANGPDTTYACDACQSSFIVHSRMNPVALASQQAA